MRDVMSGIVAYLENIVNRAVDNNGQGRCLRPDPVISNPHAHVST